MRLMGDGTIGRDVADLLAADFGKTEIPATSRRQAVF
jgi:hypothetical protein